jgi:hypothetical protein
MRQIFVPPMLEDSRFFQMADGRMLRTLAIRLRFFIYQIHWRLEMLIIKAGVVLLLLAFPC